MRVPTEDIDTRTAEFDQYYCFPGPQGLTWCEMFYNGNHVTAPTPWDAAHIADAVAGLQRLHPDAYVDELCYESDMSEAMRYQMR